MRRRATASFFLALVAGGGAVAIDQSGAPAVTGLILGRVVESGGAGVAHAKVMISGPAGWDWKPDGSSFVRRVVADEHGDFYFTELPHGDYALKAEQQGYVEGQFGQTQPWSTGRTLPLASGERRMDVALTIWKHGVATGTIADDRGAPLVGVSVMAVRQGITAGHRRWTFVRGASSDDHGEFRIPGLEADDYCFVFTGHSSRKLTFSDPAAATGRRVFMYATTAVPASCGLDDLIRIEAGQVRSGIELRTGLVATSIVEGRVSSGEEPGTTRVGLQADALSGPLASVMPFQISPLTVRPDGAFSFEGVPPGRYTLTAMKTPPDVFEPQRPPQAIIQTPAGTSPMWVNLDRPSDRPPPPPPPPLKPLWSASTQVLVGASDVTNLALALQPGARISGRLEFRGTTPPPSPDRMLQMASLSIERADGSYPPWFPRIGPTANGFSSSALAPGRYLLPVRGYIESWHLVAVLHEGREVVTPFEIGITDINDVVLVFSDRPAQIGGVVQMSGRDSSSAVEVFLFPADRRLWTDYGQMSLRFQRRRVERDGSFSSYELPPGDYGVVATTADPGPRWQDPVVLSRLAAVAERVNVRDGDRAQVNLRIQVVR